MAAPDTCSVAQPPVAEAVSESPSSGGASLVPLETADLDRKRASSSPTNIGPKEPKPVENKELDSDKEASTEINTPTAAVETKSMSPAEQEAVVKESQEEGPPRRGRPKTRAPRKPRKAKNPKEKKPKTTAATKAKAKAKTKPSKRNANKTKAPEKEKKARGKKVSKAKGNSGNEEKDSKDAGEDGGSNSTSSGSKNVPMTRVRGKKASKQDEVAQPAASSKETPTEKPKTEKRTYPKSAEKKAELSRKSCAYKKAKTKAAQEGLPEEECIKLAKKVAQQLTLIYNYVKKHAAHDVNMFLCFKGFTIPVYSPPAGLRHMQRLLETLASDFSIYGEVELQCRI